MSVRVDTAALAEVIGDFGTTAYLVTVNEDHSAHVASVLVDVRGDGVLSMGAGRTSIANTRRRAAVTLLWPPDADGSYSLLVDGVAVAAAAEAEGEPDHVVVTPRSAVLHRVAGRAEDGPTCLPVDGAERPG